jgi:hypothetical protein
VTMFLKRLIAKFFSILKCGFQKVCSKCTRRLAIATRSSG